MGATFIQLYLDLACTVLLQFFLIFSCCGDNDSHIESLEKRTKWKKRIFLTRIILGIVLNVGTFVFICVFKRNEIIDGGITGVLFCSIFLFLWTFYIPLSVQIMLFGRQQISTDDQKKKYSTALIAQYRLLEIVFDLFIFFFCQLIAKWEMYDFTLFISMTAIVDIVIAIAMLIRNIFDAHHAGWTIKSIYSKQYSHPLISFFKNIYVTETSKFSKRLCYKLLFGYTTQLCFISWSVLIERQCDYRTAVSIAVTVIIFVHGGFVFFVFILPSSELDGINCLLQRSSNILFNIIYILYMLTLSNWNWTNIITVLYIICMLDIFRNIIAIMYTCRTNLSSDVLYIL